MNGRTRFVWICAAAVAGSSALSGCATTSAECDPSKRDFFNNTSCLASGAYDRRQRELQSTLASEQQRNAAFRKVLEELQAEQAQVKGKLRARQADYAGLDKAWRDLKASLSQEGSSNRALADRVSRIDGGVQARKASDSAADAAKKKATRDDLARQIGLLERELDAGIYE